MVDPLAFTVPEVAPLVAALFQRPGGAVGCCLHIVLDDPNYADSHVESCVEYAKERGHADCYALAIILRRMSKTQRSRLAHLPHDLAQ